MSPAGVTSRVSLLTVGIVLMVTASAFEGLAAPTVLPAALEQLGGVQLYGWAFSGFWLANLVAIPFAGAEADRRGPLAPFAFGAVAFSVGLVVAGFAPSMLWVVAGRVVQGVGAGAISAVTYVAVARGYAPEDQPRMIAVMSSAWILPGLVGPALAGWVAEAHSWRWVFLALAPLLPFAAVALVPALRGMGVSKAGAHATGSARHVARDAVLLAVGAGMALSALSWGEPLPGVGLGAAGVALAFGPLRRLLPPGSLTARTERGATIAVLGLVSIAFFGVEAFVPLVVASVRNAGTVAGGLALTASTVTWAAGSWLQARLAPRVSRRLVIGAGIGLIGAGIGIEALVPISASAPIWLAVVGWAVASLGMGLAYSTLTLTVIELAPAGGEGAATASAQLANTIGIALGTGGAGGIVALAASGSLGLAPGVVIADLLMVAVAVVALAATREIPRRRPERPASALAAAAVEHGPTLGP